MRLTGQREQDPSGTSEPVAANRRAETPRWLVTSTRRSRTSAVPLREREHRRVVLKRVRAGQTLVLPWVRGGH